MRLLHAVPDLGSGGAQLTILDLAERFHSAEIEQSVLVLGTVSPAARNRLAAAKIEIFQHGHGNADDLIAGSDVVLVHFWHTARIRAFLARQWPQSRIAIYCHVLGEHPPQCLTDDLLALADLFIATSAATLELDVFAKQSITTMVAPACGSFTSFSGQPRELDGPVNVGYLGLVDPVKMHPRFVEMTSAIQRPIICDVWGPGGGYDALETAASALGASARFRFNGPTGQVESALSKMHVFGYPLASDTSATSERALQEAMFLGIPPVVFDRPGYREYICDGENALVVFDESAYTDAVTRLVDDADLRHRIGAVARETIVSQFDPTHHAGRIVAALMDLVRQTAKRQRRRPNSFGTPFQGAGTFVAAMGPAGRLFELSLSTTSAADWHKADEEILLTPAAVHNPGVGTLSDYRIVFPDDGMIVFWCALSEFQRGTHANALASLLVARRLGVPRERIEPWVRIAHAGLARQKTNRSAAS